LVDHPLGSNDAHNPTIQWKTLSRTCSGAESGEGCRVRGAGCGDVSQFSGSELWRFERCSISSTHDLSAQSHDNRRFLEAIHFHATWVMKYQFNRFLTRALCETLLIWSSRICTRAILRRISGRRSNPIQFSPVQSDQCETVEFDLAGLCKTFDRFPIRWSSLNRGE
jgi:hypothetical protein